MVLRHRGCGMLKALATSRSHKETALVQHGMVCPSLLLGDISPLGTAVEEVEVVPAMKRDMRSHRAQSTRSKEIRRTATAPAMECLSLLPRSTTLPETTRTVIVPAMESHTLRHQRTMRATTARASQSIIHAVVFPTLAAVDVSSIPAVAVVSRLVIVSAKEGDAVTRCRKTGRGTLRPEGILALCAQSVSQARRTLSFQVFMTETSIPITAAGFKLISSKTARCLTTPT
mmetsp:Transcript_13865/g.31976  ORF Transcript_13865/g.31976 Transcript_13865/m.31976 type:complete len:230 (-) Transcript_13865:5989-6678(-)